MHEPLVLSFVLPLLPHACEINKLKLKGPVLVDRTAIKVHGMRSSGKKMNWIILNYLIKRGLFSPFQMS